MYYALPQVKNKYYSGKNNRKGFAEINRCLSLHPVLKRNKEIP